MKICIHPIATITKTSGLNGDVRLRPLSRYFEEHIEQNRLMLGISSENSEVVRLELITGLGKKRRFKFRGVDNVKDAKSIVGKTLYAQTDTDDDINLISKNLIG
jgi:RimM protein, required for 16S rRNA processing